VNQAERKAERQVERQAEGQAERRAESRQRGRQRAKSLLDKIGLPAISTAVLLGELLILALHLFLRRGMHHVRRQARGGGAKRVMGR
jgi:hypothetical protein